MQTNTCNKSDAKKRASLSRHFPELENDAYKNRLTEVIGEESANSFARRAKIAPSTLLQHLNGKTLPTLEILLATAKTAGVSLLWLATGEGEKYPTATGATQAGSGYYAGHGVDEAVLTRALEAVDEALALASREVGIERKAGMVSRVYAALARPGSAADHAEVMRLIRSLL